MPTVTISNAQKEFEAAMDDFAATFLFVVSASRLRPRLNSILRWEIVDPEGKALVDGFLKHASEETVIFRGLVVSVFGAFEELVRRILRDGILAINTRTSVYDAIKDHIRKGNVYWTGKALQTIYEPVDHLQLQFESLTRNIGTCFAGSQKSTLNADAFAIFLSIFSPQALSDALRRIGVKLQWDEFGRVVEFQEAAGQSSTRDTAKWVEESFKRFGQMRNKIAHTGSSGVLVSQSDFEQLLFFFRPFGRALIQIVERELGH